jgi:hypothetical protein
MNNYEILRKAREDAAHHVISNLSPAMVNFLHLATRHTYMRRDTPAVKPFNTHHNTQQALVTRGLLVRGSIAYTFTNPFTGETQHHARTGLVWTELGYEVLDQLGLLSQWAEGRK